LIQIYKHDFGFPIASNEAFILNMMKDVE